MTRRSCWDALRYAVFGLGSWILMTLVSRNKEYVEISLEKKISVIQHTSPFFESYNGAKKISCGHVLYKECARSVKVKRCCNSVM